MQGRAVGPEKGVAQRKGGVGQKAAGEAPRPRGTPEPRQAQPDQPRLQLVEDALDIPASSSRPASATIPPVRQAKQSTPPSEPPQAGAAGVAKEAPPQPLQRTGGPAKQVQAAPKADARGRNGVRQEPAAKRKRLVRSVLLLLTDLQCPHHLPTPYVSSYGKCLIIWQ